jgi:Cu/Ag efflux protein CusF
VKKSIKVLVVAFSSLAFACVSFAQAKPATPTTPMEKKAEMKSEKHVLTGDATSVDAKAGKLTVKAKDKEINLTADSKSTKAALEKLKVGDTVRVYYTQKDGKIIAASAVKAEEKKPATK